MSEPRVIVISDATLSTLASMIVRDVMDHRSGFGHSDALYVIKEWAKVQGTTYDQQRRKRLPDGTWGPWENGTWGDIAGVDYPDNDIRKVL